MFFLVGFGKQEVYLLLLISHEKRVQKTITKKTHEFTTLPYYQHYKTLQVIFYHVNPKLNFGFTW